MLVIVYEGHVIDRTTDIYTKYDEWNERYTFPPNASVYSESCFEGCHRHCTEQDQLDCECTCHIAVVETQILVH